MKIYIVLTGNYIFMFIYDYLMVTMATISFSLLLDVLTIVLKFVVSRANRKEVMCKNTISQLLEVHALLHYTLTVYTLCIQNTTSC